MQESPKRPFTDGIAIVHFHDPGASTLLEWGIGCDAANETEADIRAHVARFWPERVIDWIDIHPIKTGIR